MLNLSSILENSAKLHPLKEAVVCGENRISYETLNQQSNQLANALSVLGITQGDKVAFACPNIPQFQIIYYGILKTGAIAVPISTMLKTDEIEYQLQNTDSKAFFCYQSIPGMPLAEYGYAGFKKVDACKDLIIINDNPNDDFSNYEAIAYTQFIRNQSKQFESVNTNESDTAVIIHTSGTTGKQKGAELTHSNLWNNARVASTKNVANINVQDNLLVALPLFHVFGQTVMMNAGILSGATLVLMPRFDHTKVFGLMDKENITVFSGVPTMFWALLRAKTDHVDMNKINRNLQTCISGGDTLPLAVFHEFKKKFNITIIEGYGMTEGSPVVTFSHKHMPIKPGSIGTPIEGVEVKLVDEQGNEIPVGTIGEIVFKGHNVMKGYYYNPNGTSETIKDGWLYSGDLAQKDEDGFYYIVGRKKDMIIRSGLNVYPKEVEIAMMKHQSISMVSVVGIPDKIKGEEVKAFAVLKNDQHVSSQEIRGWVHDRIASYKCPKEVEIVDTLPMNATGKILKRVLRDGKWYDNN